MPDSILEAPARPRLLEIDDLRGRFETQPAQRLDREVQWEGYASARDAQFVGLLGIVTAANRCSHAAREER